ncbi:MAG TPA: 3-methyl-2-oxobutanoate hydroxymethyltransferase, partial [Bryobacteraceae bacterium]|nr:3-methyl-2-oxobutanoate hydroxymethyltransferase [Bryobacteraceae bacterium]
VLTAYDFAMARIMDRAGVEVLLVGDSLGNVVLGYQTTLPVTLDAMIHHTAAVSRGARRALVVGDMPFLAAQISVPEAVRNAGRMISEGGAAAVKIEGGRAVLDVVSRLVDIGIPVMGHLGLLPQSVHQLGGYGRQAKQDAEASTLIEEARLLEKAGAFSLVLESIPPEVAGAVSAELRIPTIGIGAGPYCDGQVLVCYDMLGLSQGPVPPFVKRYADLGAAISQAAAEYCDDVRAGRFPAPPKEQP